MSDADPIDDHDDLDDAVWTDCHFHPKSTVWKPAAGTLPSLLERLGVDTLGVVALFGEADDWQAAEAPVPLLEIEDLDPTYLPPLITEHQAVHVNVMADISTTVLADLAQELPGLVGGTWEPSVLSLGWGLTTLPDATFANTAARFACSVAIAGTGLPNEPETAVDTLPRLGSMVSMRDELGALLGTPLAVTVAYAAGH